MGKTTEKQLWEIREDEDDSSADDDGEEEENEKGFDSDVDDEEEEKDEEEEEQQQWSHEAEQWRKHYSSKHKILLVGEGDFSFSLCLARTFGSAHNMVATSLDSQENVAKKFNHGMENVRELEDLGCLVLYGVDVKDMSQHFFLKTQRFDRVVYNFPHVGFLFREKSFCQIQLNKELVTGFLKNAKVLLRKEGGEIHVSHKEGGPYNQWDLVEKAKKNGLLLYQTVPFRKNDYPGYGNKRAHGKLSDAPFYLGDCNTYKFRIKSSP